MGTALRDVPADLSSRFGLAGLRTVSEKVKLHHQLEEALWYAARGLEPSLELFILATRTADLAPVNEGAPRGGLRLRPRDPGYVEDLLAKVETAADFLLRLAARA